MSVVGFRPKPEKCLGRASDLRFREFWLGIQDLGCSGLRM